MSTTDEEKTEKAWDFYYHAWGHMLGRGEYVRLMFEELGVPYVEKTRDDPGAAARFCWGSDKHTGEPENKGMPVLFPPVIVRDGFTLCQTPAILRYLGEKYGAAPQNPEDRARADMINLQAADVIAEGRLAFHPVTPWATYFDQIEEAKFHIDRWQKVRMPKFVKTFETLLAYNNGGQAFFIGDSLTYADIAVFHTLCAMEAQFPEAWAALQAPLCKAFKTRIAARPRIAAYLASDRRGQFEGNSLM